MYVARILMGIANGITAVVSFNSITITYTNNKHAMWFFALANKA